MRLHLNPRLDTCVTLPASKSISARALIVNALAGQSCAVQGLSDCDDTRAMLRALAQQDQLVFDIGAAGTAMRFLTAYCATIEGQEHVLTGTERMKHRPIGILVDALRQLGADISYEGEEGFPPLRIRGRRLRGGYVSVKADVSSQYISALLMVGPTLSEGLHLHLEGTIASRPYILMTLQLMRQFGAETQFCGQDVVVRPGGYSRTRPYVVEPDWSAASYWFALVALSPDSAARVVLPHLSAESLQGDSICAHCFEQLGVHTTFTSEGAILEKVNKLAQKVNDLGAEVNSLSTKVNGSALPTALQPLKLDFCACPDLAQTFVVAAALLGRSFHFTGLQSLHIKETDRIAALKTELAKFNIVVNEVADGDLLYDASVIASAPSGRPCPSIATYDDHRMAMAFAPAAYRFPGLNIEHPEVVSKSYPAFWDDLPILP